MDVSKRKKLYATNLVVVTPWFSLKAATVNNLSIVHFPLY
ncbi:hypothetical protein T03_14140 [Trichinella britovi]|uniref:Uncharacterized protein n=1 Tax=Trichinella britovi TaxID=45882 RepID=A0A0V1AI32_TRIBR|nr:hypothetical protein T03_14140 [Trichinella britovi]